MTQHTPDTFVLDPQHIRLAVEDGDSVVLYLGENRIPLAVMLGCFPLQAPGKMVALYDRQGREVGILTDATELETAQKRIVYQELERSYFMPVIQEIRRVEKEPGVWTWDVLTDRGARTFDVRKPKQNIRKLDGNRLVIHDVDGNRYDIPDWTQLPEDSRQYLEEYT
jgi:hypothetical protein